MSVCSVYIATELHPLINIASAIVRFHCARARRTSEKMHRMQMIIGHVKSLISTDFKMSGIWIQNAHTYTNESANDALVAMAYMCESPIQRCSFLLFGCLFAIVDQFLHFPRTMILFSFNIPIFIGFVTMHFWHPRQKYFNNFIYHCRYWVKAGKNSCNSFLILQIYKQLYWDIDLLECCNNLNLNLLSVERRPSIPEGGHLVNDINLSIASKLLSCSLPVSIFVIVNIKITN